MLYSVQILALVLPLNFCLATHHHIIDLQGPWKFESLDGSFQGIGRVPGDIYSDLHRAGIIADPLFGDNHLQLKWVGNKDWSYSRNISVSSEVLSFAQIRLVVDGIDTISTITLNGEVVLSTENQFVKYSADVKGLIKEENVIEIELKSPIIYAQNKSDAYYKSKKHFIPPVCPPDIYHGECHPNFIRKAQYSFGWDWGPSIPTVGVWKPIRVVGFNEYYIEDVTWTTERGLEFWTINGGITLFTEQNQLNITVLVHIKELKIFKKHHYYVSGNPSNIVKFILNIPRINVQPWWPNGEGSQKLYDIVIRSGRQQIRRSIGFRHVELIQELVQPRLESEGRHFYVKINDRPIFLKGSNWIPISMFLSVNNTMRQRFLLDSAVESGMNTLRVWGGGVYESEEFYEDSNKRGILVWQDLMFACALYPVDKTFLKSVEEEIYQQVSRLKKHPSVLLWAANNEIEMAIRSHWWTVKNYSENQQVYDYLTLYKDIISPIVHLTDTSRPFVLSSPSNGYETEKEGGVAKNPNDPRYGDIHFYNEFTNLWKDSSYPIPRCATEYGVQSIPFRSTMLRYINESHWYYASPQFSHRQHHPAGLFTNLLMVFSHFPIPVQCSRSFSELHTCNYLMSSKFIDRFAYFSQAHQAITYKIQTEHYRRYRNRLNPTNLGNTMCALFWQLNDVWAAPTWSSIDADLNWKMVHYEARRFFAPIIVSLYTTVSKNLGIVVTSDIPRKLSNVTLRVDVFTWSNHFQPVFSMVKIIDIEPMSASEIVFGWLLDIKESDFIFKAILFNTEGQVVSRETTLLPDSFIEVNFDNFGDVYIDQLTKIDNVTYALTLKTNNISPLTWIQVHKSYLGWFSDNGFTMTSPDIKITLHLWKELLLNENDFSVCNLKNCGL